MRENSIQIPFEKGKGLLNIDRLHDLNAPKHCIERVKRTFEKNINNKMDSFQINKWLCLALPIGLLIIILGAALLKDASSVLIIFFGLFIMFMFPMYLCVKLEKLNKAIDKIVERVNYKTKGYIVAIPKFKKKLKRTNSGPRSFKILDYFIVKVNESVPVPKRRKSTYYENEKNKNEMILKKVSKEKNEIKMKINDDFDLEKEKFDTKQKGILKLSKNFPDKKDFDTSPIDEFGAKLNAIRKKNEDLEEKQFNLNGADVENNISEKMKEKFDEAKSSGFNVDMIQVKDNK